MTAQDTSDTQILEPGRNCWRKERADRCAVLIDVEAYFRAFAAAAERARRSIMIVGWDFNGQVALRRDADTADPQSRIGPFLDALVGRNRQLQVHILIWDWAMIYSTERELLPLYRRDWRAHRRVYFELDDVHPIGASHHQKIAVVDDKIAFVGGIDFAPQRWDTSEHAEHEPRRVDPRGQSYRPFHDVQMAVDGPAARAIGDLVRRRWQVATGRTLAPTDVESDPWPPDLEPDLESVPVAIARTQPGVQDVEEAREVERAYLDGIASARSSVYIENQYFTSHSVGRAIEGRLREDDAPEFAVVSRRSCSGWLEDRVMSGLRARLLKRIGEVDSVGRFAAYYPISGKHEVDIHSKVMIVDDHLLRVGSANLANRSMGADTECDLIVEATSESARRGIRRLRARLLADQLGTSADRVEHALSEASSLIGAIDQLRAGSNSLERLPRQHEQDAPSAESGLLRLADPEQPIDADLIEQLFRDESGAQGEPAGSLRGKLLAGAALAVTLAGMWHFCALGDAIDARTIAAWLPSRIESPLAMAAIAAAFVPASLTLVPIAIPITVCALIMEPMYALVTATCGCLSSATISFGLGRRLHRRTVRRLAGSRLNQLTRKLQSAAAVLPLATLRLVPVAPFAIVNVVAGAIRVPYRTFLTATALGMAPGIVALIAAANGARFALALP